MLSYFCCRICAQNEVAITQKNRDNVYVSCVPGPSKVYLRAWKTCMGHECLLRKGHMCAPLVFSTTDKMLGIAFVPGLWLGTRKIQH